MIDFHAHTNLSYCADPGLTPEVYSNLIKTNSEVDSVYITDHGMAVYFPSETAWKWEFLSDSRIFDAHRDWGNDRLARHLANLAEFRANKVYTGLEVELMHDGRLTIDDSFRNVIDILIGSVHYLSTSPDENRKTIMERWRKHTKKLINSGIDVLGHPFRWISNQTQVPKETVRQMVKEAKSAGVAIELNSHYEVATDVEMLRACADLGVPVSIATDSHSISEIGDFSYHLSTIEAAGLSLTNIRLFTPKIKPAK